MLSSSYVRSFSQSYSPIIQMAQRCSSDMTQATLDMNSYWNGLGQKEFKDNCQSWVRSMNQLSSNLSSIQSALNSYADQLYQEEERRRREREAELEAQRQAAIRAAMASNSKK